MAPHTMMLVTNTHTMIVHGNAELKRVGEQQTKIISGYISVPILVRPYLQDHQAECI